MLNDGGACVYIYTHAYAKSQFGGGSKTTYFVANKHYVSALSTRHRPSESTTVLRNYIFKQFEKLRMQEGQERSPPAGCTVAKHGSGSAGLQWSACKPCWEYCRNCTLPVWIHQQQFSSSKYCMTSWHTHFPWLNPSVPWWLCKAWLNTGTSAPCSSCVQDEPRQIQSHLVAFGVVTTLRHMERGQLPDQLSFPCLIS